MTEIELRYKKNSLSDFGECTILITGILDAGKEKRT